MTRTATFKLVVRLKQAPKQSLAAEQHTQFPQVQFCVLNQLMHATTYLPLPRRSFMSGVCAGYGGLRNYISLVHKPCWTAVKLLGVHWIRRRGSSSGRNLPCRCSRRPHRTLGDCHSISVRPGVHADAGSMRQREYMHMHHSSGLCLDEACLSVQCTELCMRRGIILATCLLLMQAQDR